jgi:anti-sigma regulatory factor (Ser/Thr protein kinase)
MAARAERSAASSELCLRTRASELLVARHYAARAAAAFGLNSEDREDFVHAVNEAVTNAIRHGEPDGQGRILVSVRVEGARLAFSVRDSGRFAMPAQVAQAGLEGGRGFALMGRLVDDVRLQIDSRGTTVTLTKERA